MHDKDSIASGRVATFEFYAKDASWQKYGRADQGEARREDDRNTSLGPDNLHPRTFALLPDTALDCIAAFFMAALACGSLPPEANVMLIALLRNNLA